MPSNAILIALSKIQQQLNVRVLRRKATCRIQTGAPDANLFLDTKRTRMYTKEKSPTTQAISFFSSIESEAGQFNPKKNRGKTMSLEQFQIDSNRKRKLSVLFYLYRSKPPTHFSD
ncbi:hypothetical protein CEXT_432801 [Caerostris extrusa]|uniref:Uncharacterized protein n=1 Tax=Caerostris extrusa TaxID=172846 RepID=A0AAV4WTI3_CAEEX|nr:hypothetical protein CEXT_432801 [Caerostris extrusa]